MDHYLAANRTHWDELVPIHARSASYNVAGFKGGRISLDRLEREELGDVRGKSLLHLQCHFGLDTLSWARLGAQVTGVDFSAAGIEQARALSAELDIPAQFICSDIYELPNVLSGQFDVVYTSYGVLTWLPDLPRWGQIVAHFLRPGGVFYIAEIHPFANVFYEGDDAVDLRAHYSYFYSPEPLRFEDEGSYADAQAQVANKVTYEWTYTLADTVSALTAAGLRIEFLHEFPWCCFQKFPFLEQDEEGRWWQPGRATTVPMTFSLKATHEHPGGGVGKR